MYGYSHYIRLDAAGVIILGFSDAFSEIATPQDGDICIQQNGPRHFTEVWPEPLTNERGQFRYKWIDGQRVERAQEELDAEWAARPPEPETPDQIANRVLDERTQGMQAIDDFTMQQQGIIEDRTQGMQAIDDFTLDLAYQLQATIDAQAQQITQLQADVAKLKGGA